MRDKIRQQIEAILVEVKTLPDEERVTILREIRSKITGSIPSARKSASSAENGKKGGRPKKVTEPAK